MKLDKLKIYYLGNLTESELLKFRIDNNYSQNLSDNKQIKYSFYDEIWESMYWSTSKKPIYINSLK